VMDAEEVTRLRDEVARLQDTLEAERRNAEQWRQVAEERRVTLEKLRQRRTVRMLLALAGIVLPWGRRTLDIVRRIDRGMRRLVSSVEGLPARVTAGRRQRRLEGSVRRLPDPSGEDPRTVSVVVLTRDGRANLERLLPWLRRTRGVSEIVIVDNGSGAETSRWIEEQAGIRSLRNESNLTFSEANNRAAQTCTSDVLVFLNDDVEPLEDGWLLRMLEELRDDVVAVGSQLVYPRRGLLAGRTRDLGVQHLGIGFEPVGGSVPRVRNLGHGSDPDPAHEAHDVAAVTAACLVISRAAYQDVGGFDGRYDYGAEDVDLCWRLSRTGGRIRVVPSAVLYHYEGVTRHREHPQVTNARQERNWDLLAARFGPELTRAVELDRIRAGGRLSNRPYEIAITVTRDLESAGYGDWYTAHELGDAFLPLGWRVHYIERYRDAWYDLPPRLDAILVLHDSFDVRRVNRPGLTTVAWVRNWTDRWLSHPWFDDFDTVAASSGVSAQMIAEATRHRPEVVPLASNPARFRGDPDAARAGVVLTANYWGESRGIEELVAAVPEVALYGKSWDQVPGVAAVWRGALPYDQLPDLYRSSQLVIDQTAGPTLRFGALNSRVFDALAAGALVVTDQVRGAREVLGGDVPTYGSPEELRSVVRRLLADPDESRGRARTLHERVLSEHTYVSRAAWFRDRLEERAQRASIVIKIGAPNRREARSWGDTFYAEALASELRAAGHRTLVQTLDEWDGVPGRAFDVSLHLKGRSRAPRFEGQLHALWVISHPEELTPEEVELADVVFVASRRLLEYWRARTQVPVHLLRQATDHRRFRPRTRHAEHRHTVVFVGNSRFVERPIVHDAIRSGVDVAIYGANWEGFIDRRFIVQDFIPNEQVPVVYSSADIVLNDHWPGMVEWGLISNRIFDALACRACVVSDHNPELEEVFGEVVATYRTPEDLRATITDLLSDRDGRSERGARGRAAVVAGHTFAHRAAQMLHHLQPLVADRWSDARGEDGRHSAPSLDVEAQEQM